MGGDSVVSHDHEDDLSFEQDFSMLATSGTPPYLRDVMSLKVGDRTENGNMVIAEIDGVSGGASLNYWELNVSKRRIENIQRQILRTYDDLRNRSKNLEEEKEKILRYKPGAWIEKVGCLESCDYNVPTTTSLILIGPRGSGKSSLINRISKTFEDDKLISARAQISYNSYVGDGTTFLREYMIPRKSTSFCLYDTCSLSDDISENNRVLKQWIDQGVRHGQLVTWDTEGQGLRKRLRMKDVHSVCLSSEIRPVNFVIFVVDGLSVLKSMESASLTDYEKIITSTFHFPQLTYQDDKPVVVFTHGDLLSLSERARVRTHLAELLGIPPAEQIFDIPDFDDPETQLAIIDMLRYSLEHAERNFPQKIRNSNKVPPRKKEQCEGTWSSLVESHLSTITFLACMIMLITVVVFATRNAEFCINPHFHVYDDAQGHANIIYTSKNQEVIPWVELNTGQHATFSAKPEVIPLVKPKVDEHATFSAKPEVIPPVKPKLDEHAAFSAKPEVIPPVTPKVDEHAAFSGKPEVIPHVKPKIDEHAAFSAKPEVIPPVTTKVDEHAAFSAKPEVIPPVTHKVDEHAAISAKPEVIPPVTPKLDEHAAISAKPEVIPQVKPKVDEYAACFAEPEEVREVKPEKTRHAAFFAKPDESHNDSFEKDGDIPQVKRRKNQHTASFAKRKEISKDEAKINWHAIRHLWYDG